TVAAAGPKKRAVPDYSGRGTPPPTVLDRLAWIPRIALFPVRIVTDYGLRAPIGWLTRTVETSRSTRKVFSYLFLGPASDTPSIYPVVLYDFGSQPSIGVRLSWGKGFLTPGSKLTIKLGTGGLDWWRVDTAVRVAYREAFLGLEAGARRQPDYRFYGLGPRTQEAAAARYGARRLTAKLSAGGTLNEWGEVAGYASVMNMTFRSEGFGDDPTIEERVADGQIANLPNGYPGGYATVRAGGVLSVDTRLRKKRVGSGARLDAKVERVRNMDTTERWTRVELRGGGALLLDPVGERKLDVKLEVDFVEPADPRVRIPFLELVSVAGSGHLRGFPSGRLYGESAAALTLDYHWPIAAWLDAHAHLGAGNVFGPHLSGFSAGAMRASAGFGVSLAGLTEERFIELSTSIGTAPLDQGLDVTSFRLLLGFTNDY
ncbi:MAG: hypothetical protein ABI175_26000, partial [Polyangiales bacterium]